jgi:hypothetical protein
VAIADVRRVIGFEAVDGHLPDTREEAAYAGGCFVLGVMAGTRWKRARTASR